MFIVGSVCDGKSLNPWYHNNVVATSFELELSQYLDKYQSLRNSHCVLLWILGQVVKALRLGSKGPEFDPP